MTYRATLRDLAMDNHGLVTTVQAREAGVPAVEVRKLAARGALERVGHGVYRIDDAPLTPQTEYAEAVLLVGPDAYLTHDAVLALHGLGLVNPRHIRIGTPRRVRGELPTHIRVTQQQMDPADLTEYEGVPSTTLYRALRDCIGLVMPDRLVQAAVDAHRAGLLDEREYRSVRRHLRSAATQPA